MKVPNRLVQPSASENLSSDVRWNSPFRPASLELHPQPCEFSYQIKPNIYASYLAKQPRPGKQKLSFFYEKKDDRTKELLLPFFSREESIKTSGESQRVEAERETLYFEDGPRIESRILVHIQPAKPIKNSLTTSRSETVVTSSKPRPPHLALLQRAVKMSQADLQNSKGIVPICDVLSPRVRFPGSIKGLRDYKSSLLSSPLAFHQSNRFEYVDMQQQSHMKSQHQSSGSTSTTSRSSASTRHSLLLLMNVRPLLVISLN